MNAEQDDELDDSLSGDDVLRENTAGQAVNQNRNGINGYVKA